MFVGVKAETTKWIHIAVGTSLSVFFCLLILIIGVYCSKRLRLRDRHTPGLDHVEVRYVAATSGSNTTDRLLTLDQSDSSKTPEHMDQIDHTVDNNHTGDIIVVNTETPNEVVKNKENHTSSEDHVTQDQVSQPHHVTIDHMTQPRTGTGTLTKIQKVSIV